MIQIGESTKISGKLEGDRNTGKEVEIILDERTVGRTQTSDEGEYEWTIRPETVGKKQVKAKSEGLENTVTLEVTPTVSITSITTSSNTEADNRISVCPEVVSEGQPDVEFYHNGDKKGEKTASGEVCFDTIIRKGENTFRTVAEVQGDSDSREITRTTGLNAPVIEGERQVATGGFSSSATTWKTFTAVLGLVTALAVAFRRRIISSFNSTVWKG